MDQAALQVNADSPASDNVYYLVAMGGGGEEGAFGTINTFNLTAESGVKVSSDLAGCLTGYRFSAVEEGCSVAKLVDVQAAFPSLTFFAPPATVPSRRFASKVAGASPGLNPPWRSS
jgi:hypothetical protein